VQQKYNGGDGQMTLEIGKRMKEYYEERQQSSLMRRVPVIIRLDGKAFHTLTSGLPAFSPDIRTSMLESCNMLLEEIQGARVAYTQSDEISVLVVDYDKLESGAWFDYNTQKIVSVSASVCSVAFSLSYGKRAYFDSRAFNVPTYDVVNYFIWRQLDCIRNSVQSYARGYFSNKELNGKSIVDVTNMLIGIDKPLSDLDIMWRNGTIVTKSDGCWVASAAPKLMDNKSIISDLLIPRGESNNA
jgi:tRNA(His) guanylyltransferase